MQNRRKMRKRMQNRREMQKNALRHIFASGPCKYTRQAKTAPSTYARIIFTYARIISTYVSAAYSQRCACRFELTLIALPVIARLEDDRQCLDGYRHVLTTELTTLLIELDLGLFVSSSALVAGHIVDPGGELIELVERVVAAHTQSLLELNTAFAFVSDRILDCREDIRR